MNKENIITLLEIEILFKLVINKLKKDDQHSFRLSMDEYWLILPDEWTNFETQPRLAVGSLSEDLHYLKRSVFENEISTYSDLDRLSILLRFISETLAPST